MIVLSHGPCRRTRAARVRWCRCASRPWSTWPTTRPCAQGWPVAGHSGSPARTSWSVLLLMDREIRRWMGGWMGGWMDGRTDKARQGWLVAGHSGSPARTSWSVLFMMDRLIRRWMDGWVGGWMDGWMDGRTSPCAQSCRRALWLASEDLLVSPVHDG